MKSHSLILLLFLCILHFSCKNDDDTNEETNNSNLTDARASIASFNTIATIDLETGDAISTQNERLTASVTYENSFISLLDNRLVRNSEADFSGEPLWEIDITNGSDSNFDFGRTQMIVHNDIAYLHYTITDTHIPLPLPTLTAVDANTGNILWIQSQIEYEFRRITMLNNRIITAETFNNETRITSRDILDGSILSQWQVDERISHLITGNNEVIVMSWSNAVYSVDEELNINWSFETTGSNVQIGSIIGNQFLFHSRDENIYAINLQSGSLNWSQSLPDLFISDFFTDSNTVWSTTRDFSDNTIVIKELDINNGTIYTDFSIPSLNDANEIEFINFNEYLLIISDPNTGATITQLLNYKTQNLVWENEIALDNISILRANVLLETNRYALSSFF